MGLNLKQFRDLIVVPTLKEIGLHSKAAERLVIGTALAESGLSYLHQVKGPALGLYQCEPFTYQDIYDNYLLYKTELFAKVNNMAHGYRDPDELIWNLKYATAICRIHYRRNKNPLPDENDIEAIAQYWKSAYNTSEGKGTVEGFIRKAQQIMEI